MFIKTRQCEQTTVCSSFTNAHTSKLLATLLGVHVCLIVAKMPLHSSNNLPWMPRVPDSSRDVGMHRVCTCVGEYVHTYAYKYLHIYICAYVYI